MHKRFLFFLFALILLPVCCHAERWTEDVYYANGLLKRRLFLFHDELPPQLVAPMADWGYGDARILSGAAVEEPGDAASPEGEPESLPSFSALMLAEIEGETQLIGTAWVEGQPWQVVNFGSRLLRQTEHLSLGFEWEVGRPAFSIGYFGMEEDQYDLFMFSGNRCWEMVGHSRSHIKISTLHNTATIKEGENAPRTHYLTQGPFWMESMSSISEYPTTRAACEQLQQAALLAEEAADSVLCGRTLAGCALSAQAYDSSPALELPAGTSFHILAETENDRLHIYVPSGGLGSEVDTNGTYGYVSKSAVITGASAATLDVLEKEAEN